MLHAPRVNLGYVTQAIRWALFSSYSRDTPVTLRDAKRLYTGERPIPHDAFDTYIGVLTKRGEVRHFRKPLGTPGRPTVFLLPANLYKVVMDEDGLLHLAPSHTPVEVPPSYASFREIYPEFSDPEPETDEPEVAAEPAHLNISKAPISVSPPPEPEPDPEPEAATEDEPQPEEAPAPEPSPEPAPPEPEPNPEPLPDPNTQGGHTRESAFAIMRALARRSVKERDGMGVTSAELMWVLRQKGFSESEANEYFSSLAGAAPEAYMEGGLRRIPPSSPGNNTDKPRYFVRTPAQAVDRDTAEWEVKKRDALAAQLAAKKAKEA